MEFITPPENRLKRLSNTKIDILITAFNDTITTAVHSNNVFRLNTASGKIPNLYDSEFNEVKERAERAGYRFTRHADNYQTTTYRLEWVGLDKPTQ
jgi:hypothetical protein